MKDKDEILDECGDGSLATNECFFYETEVLKAMDEYAEQIAIEFIEWAYNECWQHYDSHETWINLEQNNRVLTTANLFKLFKKEKEIQ